MRFRHLLIAGTMLAITTPAFAWDYNQYGTGQQIGDNATGVQNNLSARASAAAAASSSASSASRSGSVATQRQGQSTSVSGAGAGAASNAGNSQNVNVGGSSSNYNARYPVNSAIAPSIGTINPCGGAAASGALQTGVFGISIGAAVKFDRMCQLAMYSQNPYAFAYACHEIDDFRAMALEAFRVGYAPRPCPEDALVVVPQPAMIVAGPEPAPVKRWAVVPCHMPFVRDAHGRCYNPNPPAPRPVAAPAPCVDEVVHICKPVGKAS